MSSIYPPTSSPLSQTSISNPRRWLAPLLAVLLLGGIGWRIHVLVERELRLQLASELETILRAEMEALDVWLESQLDITQGITTAPMQQEAILQSVELGERGASDDELRKSESQQIMRGRFGFLMGLMEFDDFLIADLGGRTLVARYDSSVGQRTLAALPELMAGVSPDRAAMSTPFLDDGYPDGHGGVAPRPCMLSVAAITDEQGRHGGYLAFRIDPQQRFTQILRSARAGESGETYAFDRSGLMLSDSRFGAELKELGLVPAGSTSTILTLHLRDPGGNLVTGFEQSGARSALPLTHMVAEAISIAETSTEGSRQIGVDAEGHRDYRGVRVVGAWTWLEEHDLGIATEVDRAEAYRPLRALQRVFGVLFGLLCLAALAALVYLRRVRGLARKVRRAERIAEKLGQYTLDEKIGEGGMGQVYRGHHAMLRRPTAIKLLLPDQIDADSIARFEREVQLTAQLTHPNTIAIYDYGRTPDGVFYYAMEYLEGLSLADLVKRHGQQPEGRVIHILAQVCRSLAEAHASGMVHRDIKPANILLCERGGVGDFVKVLDFGLVKRIRGERDISLTAANLVVGTPAFMAPESFMDPGTADNRADLYAVGAVGYYLLSGSVLFHGSQPVEVAMKHVKEPPPPMSTHGISISSDLETVIMRCLAKDPLARYSRAAELAQALEACEAASAWTEFEIAGWWQRFRPGAGSAPEDSEPSEAMDSAEEPHTMTIEVDKSRE